MDHQEPALGSLEEGCPVSVDPFLVLPLQLWCYHIFPVLTSVNKGQLRASCQGGRALVNAAATSARLELPTARDVFIDALAHSAWQLLTGLPRLKRLELGGGMVPVPLQWLRTALLQYADTPQASSDHALRGVKRLVLGTCPASADQDAAVDFERLARLLPGLRGASFTSAVPVTLGGTLAAHCPQLAELDVDLSNHDDEDAMQTLLGLAALSGSLRSLRVTGNALSVDTALLQQAILPLLPHLRRLHWDLPWSWEGLAQWAAAAPPAALTSLELSATDPIGQEQPVPLAPAGHSLAALTQLHMPGLYITDAVWANVLAQLPGLADLEVAGLEITAAPQQLLPSVRQLGTCGVLCTQRLAWCLRGMPGLKRLRLQEYLCGLGVGGGGGGSGAAVATCTAGLFEAERLLQQMGVKVGGYQCMLVFATPGLQLESILAGLAAAGKPLLKLGRNVALKGGTRAAGSMDAMGADAVRTLAVTCPCAEDLVITGVFFTNSVTVLDGLCGLAALVRLSVESCEGVSAVDVCTLACALSAARAERATQAPAAGPSRCLPLPPTREGSKTPLSGNPMTLTIDRCVGIGRAEAEQLMRSSSAKLAGRVHPHVKLLVEPHPGTGGGVAGEYGSGTDDDAEGAETSQDAGSEPEAAPGSEPDSEEAWE